MFQPEWSCGSVFISPKNTTQIMRVLYIEVTNAAADATPQNQGP